METEMYSEVQPIEAYLNRPLKCSCGRTHYVPIKRISIGPGALAELPGCVRELGFSRPCIVCDPTTYKIAAKRCCELLEADGTEATVHIIEHLGFDEATLGELVLALPHDADCVIAVGTGSITDLVRLLTYKLGLPGITVATGAPMDGFAASIGIVNVNGLKCTLQAKSTEAIIGDTDILKGAPYRMTVAGFGDLIGKVSCINDWKLSHIINGEHICPKIIELVQSCVGEILKDAPKIKERDPEVLGRVMNGLVLSGAAISLYGTSRPASGAEHHMSHYWEALGDQRGEPYAMHGEQVAVGTVLSLRLAEELLTAEVDFDAAREHARGFDRSKWEAEIRRAYGQAADEVISIENTAGKNEPEKVLKRIDSIEQNWDDIRAQLKTLPPSAELQKLLDFIGCPSRPEDIGIDRALLADTIVYSKEVRDRYTIMQLIWDLGLSEKLAAKLADRS